MVQVYIYMSHRCTQTVLAQSAAQSRCLSPLLSSLRVVLNEKKKITLQLFETYLNHPPMTCTSTASAAVPIELLATHLEKQEIHSKIRYKKLFRSCKTVWFVMTRWNK
jgi:hypothetical protein